MPNAENPAPGLTRLPDDAKRVIISVNPKAGRRSARPAAEELARFLAQRNLRADVLTDLAEVAAVAAEAQAQGDLRAVVAAGGDGTVTEMVNRLPVGAPLTVLPLGTENLLAKYLGIRREVESVGETIVRGAVARMDAGRAVSPRCVAGQEEGRLFLLMATCGLDADVIYRVEQARRGHISHLSYAKPIIAAFRNYKYPPLRIEPRYAQVTSPMACAGPVVARWMFLFNLPCYARGLPFTPRASGHDGLFDLCAFERGSFWSGMRYLVAVLRGRHERLADCTLRQVTGLRVETAAPDEDVPFQLDGDFGGYLPLEIDLLPTRVTLVVPEAWLVARRAP